MMPSGTREFGRHIEMLNKDKIDKGREEAIRIRMSGLITARNSLDAKIKNLKNQGADVTALEKALKSYDRDINGHKKTLGIK